MEDFDIFVPKHMTLMTLSEQNTIPFFFFWHNKFQIGIEVAKECGISMLDNMIYVSLTNIFQQA